MVKSVLALTTIALAVLGERPRDPEPHYRLQEEQMFLEYNASTDEIGLVVQAEIDRGLDRVEVESPDGRLLFGLRAARGRRLGLSGFVLESREFTAHELFDSVVEGRYDLRGRTVEGDPVEGSAVLSLDLPPAPAILYPQDGAQNVPTNPVVAWVPDSGAVAYEVVLEQNENDGLTVRLPAGTGSLQVPDGVLAPGCETLLEVASIGANGNRTALEVTFTTW